jgi:hypothetical protein
MACLTNLFYDEFEADGQGEDLLRIGFFSCRMQSRLGYSRHQTEENEFT